MCGKTQNRFQKGGRLFRFVQYLFYLLLCFGELFPAQFYQLLCFLQLLAQLVNVQFARFHLLYNLFQLFYGIFVFAIHIVGCWFLCFIWKCCLPVFYLCSLTVCSLSVCVHFGCLFWVPVTTEVMVPCSTLVSICSPACSRWMFLMGLP